MRLGGEEGDGCGMRWCFEVLYGSYWREVGDLLVLKCSKTVRLIVFLRVEERNSE